MLGTIGFLIITVLMGGIIAYEGDLIGRRFGKRRVTLFGLRPRYTAILITSVTGVAISALTTGVLFAVVPSVRDAILRGEEAIRSNATLERANRNLEKSGARLTAMADESRKQALSARADLGAANHRLEQKQAQIAAADRQLATMRGQVAAAQQRLATTNTLLAQAKRRNADLTSRNGTLAMANTALAAGNVKLAAENADLTKKREELTQDNAMLVRHNGEYQQANDTLAKRNEELTRQNTKLGQENDNLDHAKAALLRDGDRLRTENDVLYRKNAGLTTENSRLSSENAVLTDIVKKFGPGYTSVREAYWAARSKRVAVHKDEDLARIVVPAGADPATVNSKLQELLQDASEEAKTHGAGLGTGFRAVEVVSREIQQQLPSGEVEHIQVSGQDRIDAVVSKLAWQSTPNVVLALAVANSVEDEPAAIDLQPLPNRRVFIKGQVVQGRYFNATQPSQGIVNDVVKFLKDMGRYALEQGVIPRMDPLSGEPQIGAMDFGEIVVLAKKIEQVGGRVRVRAIAEQDVHSADVLKVRFEVGS